MLFNSLEFVYFFCVTLAAYFALRRHWSSRKVLLLIASYVFYMTWNPPFALLLIGSTVLDFVAGRRIRSATRSTTRRGWLIASCVGNLGVLAIFKYGDFALSNVWSLLPQSLDYPDFFKGIVLPLGISFYTFQSLSYTIDVYRGRQEPTDSLLDFALYVAFFPQLVAGPIIRSIHFLPQLESNRSPTAEDGLSGIDQIFRGLAKKVLVADTLATYVDLVYAAPGEFGAVNHLLAVYAYAFQIYCDFSGYSDIAIGTARLMGFEIPRNFRLPYLARNPSDFWTRWHISLSSWLRDYLYISLGGSRGGRRRTYRNLTLTMLLGGLWHGAAWNFVLWGAFHGIWLTVHRALFRERTGPRVPAWLAVIGSFHLVCLGWVFFRAQSLADIPRILRGFTDFTTPVYRVDPLVLLMIGVGFASHLLGASTALRRDWQETLFGVKALAYAGVAVAIFFLSQNTVRFIYFQF